MTDVLPLSLIPDVSEALPPAKRNKRCARPAVEPHTTPPPDDSTESVADADTAEEVTKAADEAPVVSPAPEADDGAPLERDDDVRAVGHAERDSNAEPHDDIVVDLERTMTLRQLRDMCSEKGLLSKGNKAELVARLRDHERSK